MTPDDQTRRTDNAPRDARPALLCQFNLAWMREPYDHPIWDSWKRHLVPSLHARALRHPGFVSLWDGQQTPEGYLAPYPDQPLVMGNLSAWKSAVSLREFVFGDPAHLAVMKSSLRWFHPPREEPYSVFYWAPQLDLHWAMTMLNRYRELGACERFFGLHELTRM